MLLPPPLLPKTLILSVHRGIMILIGSNISIDRLMIDESVQKGPDQ